MPVTVWTVDPYQPDPTIIRQAAEIVKSGRIVAFPTETVYGLGGNALDSTAVERIYAIKGRPAENPLIVHVADEGMLDQVAADWPPLARQLSEHFWPGPLTIVVPRAAALPVNVTAGGSTVAIRCPKHIVAQALLRAAGVPIAAPSANRSGQLSPTLASHVLSSLGEEIDALIDGGACPGGLESTVVDVSGPKVRLLRPGLIRREQLEAEVGPIEVVGTSSETGALPSPGMLARHYAPRTALETAETVEEAEFLAKLYETAGLKVARLSITGDPDLVAAQLYAQLHELDSRGYDRIIVTLPPESDTWLAIRDRLLRAATTE